MKSFTTMLALPALFIGAFAAPAASPEKRQVQEVVSTVEGLFKQVTTITGNLNTTVSGVTGTVGSVDNVPSDVVEDVQGQIRNLVTLVNSTAGGLPIVGGTAGVAVGAVGPVAEVAAKLVTEITATLGNVEKVVPLELITTEVGQLTSVLSGLLGTVAKLLDIGNLVQTVTGLVGGVIPLTSVTSILGGVTSAGGSETTSVTNLLGGLL